MTYTGLPYYAPSQRCLISFINMVHFGFHF